MELKDTISAAGTAISALLIVLGWFISKLLDRKHEKFKMRLAKREEIANALAEHQLNFFIGQANDAEWQKLSLLIQIYGMEDEIRALTRFGEANGENIATQAARLNELSHALVSNVREELGYN